MNKFIVYLASTLKILAKPFFPVKFYGTRKLEKKKTLLLGNHISGWDPILYSIWCKTWISFVYKAEFRKSAFLRWVFDGLDCIPVRRGQVDVNSSKTILKLLNEEKIVGLFPEGTRNPNVDCLQKFHTGAALYALKTHAPIRLFYTWEKAKAFHKNYVIVGEEFTVEQYYDRPITKELLLEVTEEIRQKMDDLRVKLNGILAEKGIKRRKRTKKEIDKINRYNQRQKTLAKELAKQQNPEENK